MALPARERKWDERDKIPSDLDPVDVAVQQSHNPNIKEP